MIRLNWPPERNKLKDLKTGEEVLISGIIYSARDQAHKRMTEILEKGEKLPFELDNSCIYYMGPAPTPPGEVIGSCGPTTSSRMDPFTPELLKSGLSGIIGKGNRSEEVRKAIAEYNAVYFYAYGGCGALYADRIISAEVIAFPDLGPEAVMKLEVSNFPVIVAINSKGESVFK